MTAKPTSVAMYTHMSSVKASVAMRTRMSSVKASVAMHTRICLVLYDLFHVLRPFLTNSGSMECNKHLYMYVCQYLITIIFKVIRMLCEQNELLAVLISHSITSDHSSLFFQMFQVRHRLSPPRFRVVFFSPFTQNPVFITVSTDVECKCYSAWRLLVSGMWCRAVW
jgi:hypothetical protein